MKQEIAQKWSAALRSGEFKQGKVRLRPADGYCCLGVLCELYRRETGEGEWHGGPLVFVFETPPKNGETSSAALPNSVMEWSGIGSAFAMFDQETRRDLSQENDTGTPFSGIADIIDKKWADL